MANKLQPNKGFPLRRLLADPAIAQDLTLIAGAAGLDRMVTWVYMAECFNEVVQPEEWLSGGELVFFNGKHVGDTEEALMSMAKRLDRMHVAGMVIVSGRFIKNDPTQLVALCNELSLPLLALGYNSRYVEVTYNIGQAIFSNNSAGDAAAALDRGISCRRILSEPALKGLHLRAGEAGLDRIIHWVYMAECFSERITPEEWLCGHELIFVTGKNAGATTEELVDLVIRLNKMHCAGVVLMENPYLTSVSEEAIRLCNELEMPLFSMDYDLKVVNISYYIGQLIIAANERANLREQYAGRLIRGTAAQIDEACGEILVESGIDVHSGCCMGVLHFPGAHIGAGAIASTADSLADICARLKLPVYALPYQNLVLFFVSAANSKHKVIVDTLQTALRSIGARYAAGGVNVGVSEVYRDSQGIPIAYRQALKSCICARCTEKSLVFYSETGLYAFLLSVQPPERLDSYYQQILGPLIQYDQVNGASLLDTLKCYFSVNRSAESASEALFVHRNTLKYRLQKIEDLLKRNLNDIEDITVISMCLKIGRLMESSELLSYLQTARQ